MSLIKSKRFFFALALALSTGFSSGVRAQDNDLTFQSGVRAYNNNEFKNAINLFRSAQRESPYDFRPFYYEAMCFSKMGQTGAARKAFGTLINKFPDSEGAELARKALSIAPPGTQPVLLNGLKKLNSLTTDKLPKEVVLPAEDNDGKPVVTVKVGGHDVKMMINSDAKESMIGEKIAVSARLALVTTSGRSKNDEGAYVLYDIAAGAMSRAAMPVFISSKAKETAILGADFLSGYSLSYDKEAKTVKLSAIPGASDPFATGMKLFNLNKAREALPFLRKAAASRPQDPRALYCLAVCLQKTGFMEEARTTYRQVRKRFGNTEASFLAGAALEQLDPSYRQEMRAMEAAQRNNTGRDRLPKEELTEVPYTVENSRYKVNAYFDNQNTECYFEPNASSCIFSLDQLRMIDSSYINDNTPRSETSDAPPDANQALLTTTYQIKFRSVKLGKVEQRNVPATVSETRALKGMAGNYGTYPRPILSGYVINGLTWEIDTGRRVIKIWRKIP